MRMREGDVVVMIQGGRRRCEKNRLDERESAWSRETDGAARQRKGLWESLAQDPEGSRPHGCMLFSRPAWQLWGRHGMGSGG